MSVSDSKLSVVQADQSTVDELTVVHRVQEPSSLFIFRFPDQDAHYVLCAAADFLSLMLMMHSLSHQTDV